MKRLVLGTAQLGMNYGIANRTGQPDFKTAESIIKTVWESGIIEFDTAQAYGESEHVLGNILHSLGIRNEVKIISKFHPDLDHCNQNDLLQALEKTLSDLKIFRLYGLIIHREEFLDLWDEGLGEILSGFVSSGLVEHLGVSVYSPEKAVLALETDGINIVQLPSNIFDRRFEKAGVFRLTEDNGKQIYVRSVFLQGLMLMSVEELPGYMKFAVPVLKRLDKVCRDSGFTHQSLALCYVRDAYPFAKVIFGAETPEQVKGNMACWSESLPVDLVDHVREVFDSVEEEIVNPVLWKNEHISFLE